MESKKSSSMLEAFKKDKLIKIDVKNVDGDNKQPIVAHQNKKTIKSNRRAETS